MNLLIKNANVIDANGKFQGDILIIDGIINQIAATLKVRSFVVNKLLGQARQFTIDQLIRCVERCVELEEAVKRGNMNERIAVEMVLLSIANREYHA